MFVQKLALARNISAVTLGDDVFSQSFDCLTGNDVRPDSRLYGDVVHLAGDDLSHFGHHRPTPVLRLRAVHDDGQCIYFFAVKQDVDLHHIGGPVFLELVVHRGIAARHRLELVEKIQHDLGERHLVGQHHLPPMVGHVQLHTPLLVGQGHHRAHVILRHVQVHRHDGLAHLVQPALLGHLGRVLHHAHFAVGLNHLVDHAGGSGDQVLVKLALESLLHDFHVQQAEKAATKTKTQRLGHLWLVMQRGIIELEFLQAVAQAFVLVGLGRVEAGENLRLDLLETRQGFAGGQRRTASAGLDEGNGIADLGRLQLPNTSNDVAHFTSFK